MEEFSREVEGIFLLSKTPPRLSMGFFFVVFNWHCQTAYTYTEKVMGDQMVILLETLNAFSAGLGDRL